MYDESTVNEALEALSLGFTQREAADLAGVSHGSVARWAAGVLPHRRGAPRARVEGGAKVKRAKGRAARPDELPQVVGDEPAWSGFDGDAGEQIRKLQLENDILRGMVEVLKGVSLGQASNREKSLLIEWLRRETCHPLKDLTASLGISKSSYEYWRAHLHDVGVRELVGDDVERIFREKGRSARGYRFVHAELVAERGGEPISEKVVRDVMRERGLVVVYRRKARRYSSYAGEIDEAPANLPLDAATGRHDFSAEAPGEKWVSDITEFKLPGDARKVYLSPIVDLYDTKPVAWSMGTSPDAELANSSLRAACATLEEGGPRPWLHTDRGCHYRWPGWKSTCEENGIVRSMSRKGCSPDNAAMEGFFGRLKNEFFHGRDWSGVTAEEFMERLDAWMRFYSEGRLKAFRAGGKVVYDTIDHRREVLGLTA